MLNRREKKNAAFKQINLLLISLENKGKRDNLHPAKLRIHYPGPLGFRILFEER